MIIITVLFCFVYVKGTPISNGNEVHEHRPMENPNFFQGDIKLTEQMKKYSSISLYFGISNSNYHWPGGKIYYENTLSNIPSFNVLLRKAIKEIEDMTCIRFIKRTTEPDYIKIISKHGCYSYIGKIGGPQTLSLQTSGCHNLGIIIHELMHAIGFFHKQSQHNRDQYLTIHWDNIHKNEWHNFDRVDSSRGRVFTKSFDYSSIMLYGARSFSKDGRAITMSRKDGGQLLEVYDKPGLSSSDALSINALYGCNFK